MADSFFGFDTSHASGLDDAIDCPLDDDEIGEEDEYDALNDQTFGAEASAGDWEQDHEKLAKITESRRPQELPNVVNKNGIDVNIEESLSHLVLDEKDGIVPRPGVWDSPTILPITPHHQPIHQPPIPSLAFTQNAPFVDEVERGIIRPLGLAKPPNLPQNAQLPRNTPGPFMLDYPGLNEHLNLRTNILNNLAPPRFPPGLGLAGPHPLVLPSNVRLQSAPLLPNSLPNAINQPPNLLRYPMPHHLMLAHGNQRPPMPGNFMGNFPPPPRPNILPQFLRPDLSHMNHLPPFNNNHLCHHHVQQHTQQSQPLQQQPQQQQHQQQHQQMQHANQRNQNRPFQHNEQPANQPFFKNNQHWHQNRLNHRYHHHSPGMNGQGDNGEWDEYAGLMSTREKQWLTNIQLLQHNTNQPYFDDYYFTVFCSRQNKKLDNSGQQKEKRQSNKNGYSNRDSRDKDQQSQHVLTKVVYTPTQFENSLGKLQCGSVTAPRKIIDMDVVPNSDPQQNAPSQQKDMKKARQRLLEIERLYTIQLALEDVNNPLALVAEQQALQQQALQQQQSDQEPEIKPVKKTARELINLMLTSLQRLMKDDQLAGILSVRKGKMLLLRFLPFLSVTEYFSQLGDLWVAIIRGLAFLGRRDAHILIGFFPEFHNWLETVDDFAIILRLAKAFLTSSRSLDSSMYGNKVTNMGFAVGNKFGVSIIASLLEQAENLFPDDKSMVKDWSTFIVTLVDTIGDSTPCAAPRQPIAANTLNEHLQRIEGLTIERYAPLEALLTDANSSR